MRPVWCHRHDRHLLVSVFAPLSPLKYNISWYNPFDPLSPTHRPYIRLPTSPSALRLSSPIFVFLPFPTIPIDFSSTVTLPPPSISLKIRLYLCLADSPPPPATSTQAPPTLHLSLLSLGRNGSSAKKKSQYSARKSTSQHLFTVHLRHSPTFC